VGSNIFNILSVLGAASLAKPILVPATSLSVDLPVMVGVAIICLPIFFTGMLIQRWEGAVFLLLYVLYTTYLILGAGNSPAAPGFNMVVLYGVVPGILLLLLISGVREFRSRKTAA